ncbi:hypothetical protein RND71_005493 [Anisodus tanguticus]|uniref:Uncharacterized protein n=1 Tax=Anisodus tanguticus TaxID=243964 RepID=A0AAE1VSF0_9SOLA|nr:hypothetical protein RND71_005493 [Anisodus tanguticus]
MDLTIFSNNHKVLEITKKKKTYSKTQTIRRMAFDSGQFQRLCLSTLNLLTDRHLRIHMGTRIDPHEEIPNKSFLQKDEGESQ